MRRRDFLVTAPCWPALLRAAGFAPVTRGAVLAFPRDYGAHPDHRIEWWYVTGWIGRRDRTGGAFGFQITFFRLRPPGAADNPSRFAAKELLFAHAALADPTAGRLLAAQRSARAGFGLAQAQQGRMRVWIGDWSLERVDAGYRARVQAQRFAIEMAFSPTQPPLLHGEAGYSRKAADPRHASYYYSEPQLAVRGSVTRSGRQALVSGNAWLDHEWSSELLPDDAVGWDWVGLNLADGTALMAFRLRDAAGATLWAGGTVRAPGAAARAFAPAQVEFLPLRRWRSPRSGGMYPVGMSVRVPGRRLELRALMDDQELDARASTGSFYWEGAVRAFEAGRPVGTGYLELTGYAGRLRR